MDTILYWLTQFISPLSMLFCVILLGYIIGNIKIKGISLGLSAVLILSVLTGVLFHRFPCLIIEGRTFTIDETVLINLNFLSKLGSTLFIAVVGISAGYEQTKPKRKNACCCFLFGALMVILNLILMKVVSAADKTISEGLLYGIFCGAMTSTPGLATVCESSEYLAAQASAGYGSSYLFGVVGTVLFVQMLIKRKNQIKQKQHTEPVATTPALYGLIQLSVTILIGSIVGAIPLFHTGITLGNTGGILLIGISCGYFIKKHKSSSQIPQNLLYTFRTFGLCLFFVGTGIPSGMVLVDNLQPLAIVYGILLTIFPIFISYGLLRFILKKDKKTILSIICGVMTSTPAFGLLSHSEEDVEDPTVYSATYIGSLITTVLCLSILT